MGLSIALFQRSARHTVFLIVILAACSAGAWGVVTMLSTPQISAVPNPAPAPENAQSAWVFVNSIGVNTHLNYFDRTYGNFALVKRDLQLIDIRHVRDGVHLQNDDYNNALYGRWIDLGKMGVRFDAVLDPRSNLGPLTPALLDHVEQLAGHTIESFEGPNELDIANMANWMGVDRDYQQSIFSSVESTAGASRVQIIGPSLASVRNGKAFGGAISGFDEANLHSYPAGKMPSAIFPEQTDLANQVFGAKPIVMTESGYHNALKDFSDQPAVSEEAAAKYIPRLFLENFARGIARTYLYEFFDEAPDPNLVNNQMHWGLVRADGTEKPAFVALKNLIDELNDSAAPAPPLGISWSLNETSPAIHHLLLKKSNGTFDLVLWQEVSSYNTLARHDVDNPAVKTALILGQEARRVVLFEPVLQAAPLETHANVTSVPLSIPDHPLVVEIELK
jgi:hypothetical protein